MLSSIDTGCVVQGDGRSPALCPLRHFSFSDQPASHNNKTFSIVAGACVCALRPKLKFENIEHSPDEQLIHFLCFSRFGLFDSDLVLVN